MARRWLSAAFSSAQRSWRWRLKWQLASMAASALAAWLLALWRCSVMWRKL
jgi:hypothetical protein